MTVTRTPRLGLVRWSSDSDPWSREDIVEGIDRLEELANGINPRAPQYGATADNTTNDRAALQAALNASAVEGIPVDLGGRTYLTTTGLTIPAGAGLRNGTIRCTGVGVKILSVTGDNVTIERVDLIGRHAVATIAGGEFGIYAQGASAAVPLRNLKLRNFTVTRVGLTGVLLKWVDGFDVRNFTLTGTGNSGVTTLSAVNGRIDGFTIDTLVNISGSSYGIALTRDETDSIVTEPLSAWITVANGIVRNSGNKAYDTHGGRDLTFSNVHSYACPIGIGVGSADNGSQTSTWAPKRVRVENCIFDAAVTDGTALSGIVVDGVAGASTSAPAADYAENIAFVNVSIRRHGPKVNHLTGAAYFRNTRGLQLIGIHITEPSPAAFVFYYDNRGAVISGAVVSDVWATDVAVGWAPAILTRADNNTVYATGVRVFNTGAKTGSAYLNTHGVRDSGTPGTNVVEIGFGNDFTATTTPLPSTVTHVMSAPLVSTAGIQAKQGSPTAVGYGFQGETGNDTGLYLRAENQLGFATAGVERAYFTTANFVLTDGLNINVGGTTGTMLATASSQKLGFWGAAPGARPGATAEIKAALAAMGLLTDGGASPLDLDGGTLTVGAAVINGGLTAADGTLEINSNVALTGTLTGTVAFTPTGGIAATTVAAALAELDTEKATVVALSAHTGAAAGAHAATAISYAGSTDLSSSTVEAALDELDLEKAPKASPALTGTTTAVNLSVSGVLSHTGGSAGFFGAAAIARPGTYNLTGTPDRTLGAYASDPESSAYTGAADGEAKLVDLNSLRAAYENLRTYVEDLAGLAVATATDLKALGLVG